MNCVNSIGLTNKYLKYDLPMESEVVKKVGWMYRNEGESSKIFENFVSGIWDFPGIHFQLFSRGFNLNIILFLFLFFSFFNHFLPPVTATLILKSQATLKSRIICFQTYDFGDSHIYIYIYVYVYVYLYSARGGKGGLHKIFSNTKIKLESTSKITKN